MSFRDERIRSRKSVEEVAKHMGVTTESVYMWETGTTSPHIDRLPKLANFLECSIEDLLRDNPIKRSVR